MQHRHIAIVGSHGVGKSTLGKALLSFFEDNLKDDWRLEDNAAREVANKGQPVNENATNQSQYMILENYINKCNIITSYSTIHIDQIMRNYVYSKYAQNFGTFDNLNFVNVTKLCAIYELNYVFDVIFYLPIEFDLKKNGVRSLNVKYQKIIDEYIKQILSFTGTPIHTITGPVKDRLYQIEEKLIGHNIIDNNVDFRRREIT